MARNNDPPGKVKRTIYMNSDEHEALAAEARRRRTTSAAVLRRAIRRYVGIGLTHPGGCKNPARGLTTSIHPRILTPEMGTTVTNTPHAISSAMLLVQRQIEECPLWLRNLRLRAGWTQRRLADAVGVHQPNISQYENGVHTPDAVTSYLMVEMLTAAAGDNDHDPSTA